MNEGKSDHPDYLLMDTDGIESQSKTDPLSKKVVLPSLSDIRKETRTLDRYQREILDMVVKYSRDIVKARRDGNIAPLPIYLTVHGGARTGQSTVINLNLVPGWRY